MSKYAKIISMFDFKRNIEVLVMTEWNKSWKEQEKRKVVYWSRCMRLQKIQKRPAIYGNWRGNYDVLPGAFYARCIHKQ